jgi:hypothetical protein
VRKPVSEAKENILQSKKLVLLTLEKIGHIRAEYNEGNISIANAAAFHLLHDVETIMRMSDKALFEAYLEKKDDE